MAGRDDGYEIPGEVSGDMKLRPLISVLMAVKYTREDIDLLARSINSILQQTYQNIELLICENGSNQEAKDLLQHLSAYDTRIRLIDSSGAELMTEKLNRCFCQAKGSWIARMDADDYSIPERFEKQIGWLAEHSEVSFVGCSVELEQDGRTVGLRKLPDYPSINDFLFVQPFIHPALLFRREALDAVGGYCERPYCAGCEDYDLLLRLYEKGHIGANIRTPLLRYTLPPAGTTNRTFKMRRNEVLVRYIHFRRLGLLPQKLPYVVKPVAVGLLPRPILEWLKAKREEKERGQGDA